ncbi:MAG: vWA domain-containing protein [Planctomycetota bacterium]|jgi:hypothetical protein
MTPRPSIVGPRASRLALFLCSACIALPALVCAQKPEFEVALKRYNECVRRLPFRFHTVGRETLASTRDPRALEILIKDYKKPGAYPVFTRYTVATLLGKHFDDYDAVDALVALRNSHRAPGDAWLWIHALTIESRQRDNKAALKVARESKSLVLRAAAIQALAERGGPGVLAVVPEACANLPKGAGERRLMIGALSSAIYVNMYNLEDAAMQKAIRAYIGLLAPEVGLTRSAKMVIARYVGKTIGKDSLYITPEPWLRLLDTGYTPPVDAGHTVVQTRFFGIEAEGDRICYVIDMSDTMCKEIEPGLPKKKRGPITGPRKKKRRKKRKRKPLAPDESDIPWDEIRTRFDLAREHLKISIQRLPKDKRFCVVWFGTESGMLKSCPGMIPASPGNVQRVIRELDSIVPGAPKKPDAPDGVLRGRTNIHSGLRRAFSLRAKGFAGKHEYVDMKAMAEGCDTIFLLSDGTPSWDDFGIKDKDYKEGRVVRDQEYGEPAPRTPFLIYHGPYVHRHWLEDEVARMNVFRKVPVHCIGIGEADISLLRGIAGSSMGEVFLRGAKAKKAGAEERKNRRR